MAKLLLSLESTKGDSYQLVRVRRVRYVRGRLQGLPKLSVKSLWVGDSVGHSDVVQGYLTDKKTQPPRTLPQACVVLRGGGGLTSGHRGERRVL